MKRDTDELLDEDDAPEAGNKGNSLYVASVGKAFRVLNLFNSPSVELGLSDVAARCGLGKSASQRFLHTLQVLGYLNQEPITKAYRLSAKLLELARSYVSSDVIREKARDILDAANQICEETVNLTVLDGTNVVYILRYPSKHVVSVNLAVGTTLPAFCTAPGRVLLASMATVDQDAILAKSELKKRTEKTEIDPDMLRAILKQVRKQGYALSDQEAFVGDISIAAPVKDEQGRTIAAVNVAVPFPRWQLASVQRELRPIVVDTARKVSVAIGWQDDK